MYCHVCCVCCPVWLWVVLGWCLYFSTQAARLVWLIDTLLFFLHFLSKPLVTLPLLPFTPGADHFLCLMCCWCVCFCVVIWRYCFLVWDMLESHLGDCLGPTYNSVAWPGEAVRALLSEFVVVFVTAFSLHISLFRLLGCVVMYVVFVVLFSFGLYWGGAFVSLHKLLVLCGWLILYYFFLRLFN